MPRRPAGAPFRVIRPWLLRAKLFGSVGDSFQ
jgi:hypothetical protein